MTKKLLLVIARGAPTAKLLGEHGWRIEDVCPKSDEVDGMDPVVWVGSWRSMPPGFTIALTAGSGHADAERSH